VRIHQPPRAHENARTVASGYGQNLGNSKVSISAYTEISKRPATATVELHTVKKLDAGLQFFFGDLNKGWSIHLKAADLQTFKRFQARVADELGIWCDHHSQTFHRARSRAEEWNDAVKDAFVRGASQ